MSVSPDNRRPIDAETGFDVVPTFERFNQQNDMFNRAVWDSSVRSPKVRAFFESYVMALAKPRRVDGFTQRDYALRDAAWLLANLTSEQYEPERCEGFTDVYTLQRPVSATKVSGTPEALSADVKRAARFLGADLVGICEYDERWVYSHRYNRATQQAIPMNLPDGLTRAIVIAVRMDADTIQVAPSALNSAAPGLAYSQLAALSVSLAQFVRDLGYQAVASLNDTALSIPLAVQAGLGEYGRNGLLITREYGPRVRLAKVFTDMPLACDSPIHFGVREFCAVCRKCALTCPMRAIAYGEPTEERTCISSLRGVRKWRINPEKCFKMWVNQNTDCSICIRVCPFNKDYTRWYNRVGRRLAGTFMRRALVWLDNRLGFGQRRKASAWWNRTP